MVMRLCVIVALGALVADTLVEGFFRPGQRQLAVENEIYGERVESQWRITLQRRALEQQNQ